MIFSLEQSHYEEIQLNKNANYYFWNYNEIEIDKKWYYIK